ncbi:MAG: sulfur carrier protein ThiS [Peptoniphilus sp.]|nr:sulfur carrier protein ThiS [Peptoniphilus sp.]MDY3119060.1 sulfur carrier protein ThiS [Peptoniphilus sp.]
MKINGKVIKITGPKPLVSVLKEAGYDPNGVVLEKNGILVRRRDVAQTIVEAKDVLEVFSFTGGG